MSDPLSPLAGASSLKFSTVSNHLEAILITHESFLPLAPLGEIEEGDGFKTDASSDDQCGILVESEGTFSDEHSLDEPSVRNFSEVTPLDELSDPFFDESSLDLAPTPPISSLSSPVPILLPSLDLSEPTFVESETFVLGSPCLN